MSSFVEIDEELNVHALLQKIALLEEEVDSLKRSSVTQRLASVSASQDASTARDHIARISEAYVAAVEEEKFLKIDAQRKLHCLSAQLVRDTEVVVLLESVKKRQQALEKIVHAS
eukprot:ANDGO_02283.mRNA.1 hypothetical protein